MCLILLAWKVHPEFPLVVVANRDEFYARPSAPAAFWAGHPQVLAGRDLSAGGSWLGVTRQGRFAALTNYRDPAQAVSDRPSRGVLVADFLTGSASPADYLAATRDYGARCNGYNLLVGDGSDLWWASNVSGEARALPPGVYGVSNHLLDTAWPKVGAAKTALQAALERLPDELALRQLLADPTIHPDEYLPSTGIPIDWERALSAAFIRVPGYGTRASTILKVSRGPEPRLSFDEQTWLPEGAGERRRYVVSVTQPIRAATSANRRLTSADLPNTLS